MASVKMSNGICMPLIGYGTGGKQSTPKALILALQCALETGYRHFDTAYWYGNEQVVGAVLEEYIKSGRVSREELFITTKLPPTAHHPAAVEKCLRGQLEQLRMDYVDLYLIHAPTPLEAKLGTFEPVTENGNHLPDAIPLIDTWTAMESVYEQKLARAIGFSNFTTEQIRDICAAARVKPHNAQFELHVYFPQSELRAVCKEMGITVTAFAPLGSPGRCDCGPMVDGPIDDPVVARIALAHGKTPAQILLRNMIQRGIAAIPKSINPERIRQNFEIFNFTLSKDEMQALHAIKSRQRFCNVFYEGFDKHPNFPFRKFEKQLHDDAKQSAMHRLNGRQ